MELLTESSTDSAGNNGTQSLQNKSNDVENLPFTDLVTTFHLDTSSDDNFATEMHSNVTESVLHNIYTDSFLPNTSMTSYDTNAVISELNSTVVNSTQDVGPSNLEAFDDGVSRISALHGKFCTRG